MNIPGCFQKSKYINRKISVGRLKEEFCKSNSLEHVATDKVVRTLMEGGYSVKFADGGPYFNLQIRR